MKPCNKSYTNSLLSNSSRFHFSEDIPNNREISIPVAGDR